MHSGKDRSKLFFKTSLCRAFLTKIIALIFLLASNSLLSQQSPLVGFSEDELEEDEAGLWMVVEKQEQQIRTSSILINDPELQEKIEEILCELVEEGCSYLRAYIIRAPGFNAFMMPNGAFFIQSGLLLRIKNDDQLASVIGHEASHYFRRHSIDGLRETYSRGNTFAVLGAVVSAASAVSINSATSLDQLSNSVNMSNTAVLMLQTAQIMAALQLLEYSRSDETEADLDSIEWMTKTSFDGYESISVWEQLIAEQEAAEQHAGFSLLSTHPASEQRIKDLSVKLQSLSANNSKSQSYSILNLVASYREDWLVDEMRILHPDQFRFVVNQQLNLGIPPYLAKYFSGLSYIDAMERDEFSNREKRAFSESALDLLKEASSFEESTKMPEIFRDLGRLNEQLENTEEAKQAYRRYIEIAPDAWDARFIRNKI